MIKKIFFSVLMILFTITPNYGYQVQFAYKNSVGIYNVEDDEYGVQYAVLCRPLQLDEKKCFHVPNNIILIAEEKVKKLIIPVLGIEKNAFDFDMDKDHRVKEIEIDFNILIRLLEVQRYTEFYDDTLAALCTLRTDLLNTRTNSSSDGLSSLNTYLKILMNPIKICNII